NGDVRKRLVLLQQKLAEHTDLVMDGRDIGTCVLPHAQLKIYLTASVHTRAMRRYLELKQKGVSCALDEIEQDISERDYRDMHREISPLKKTDDAVEVDTSDLTIDEVVAAVYRLAVQKREAC
ncbi:MAG: (d)CMP kinase, partial [Lachnospiraceae bacterium]|nr:(d)CMP kinase [Lachnospiraceae bacterium]